MNESKESVKADAEGAAKDVDEVTEEDVEVETPVDAVELEGEAGVVGQLEAAGFARTKKADAVDETGAGQEGAVEFKQRGVEADQPSKAQGYGNAGEVSNVEG